MEISRRHESIDILFQIDASAAVRDLDRQDRHYVDGCVDAVTGIPRIKQESLHANKSTAGPLVKALDVRKYKVPDGSDYEAEMSACSKYVNICFRHFRMVSQARLKIMARHCRKRESL